MTATASAQPARTTPTPARHAATPRPGALGHGAGFWVVAFAFWATMAFSAVPTPLWVLYQHRDGFSTFMITVAFAAYALGVVVSLFLAGHLSDRLGRRRVLFPAVLVEIVAAAVFLSSTSLSALITARVIAGLGTGMITATATAYLSELHATARPDAGRARSELVATTANMGGLAGGPLVSGLLAQYTHQPLRLPYVAFLAALAVSAVGVALVPETRRPDGERRPYRPQRVSVPAHARSAFFAACAAALAGFSVLGLFTSLAPSFVAGTLHHPARALAGLVTFLAFGAAATTQIALARVAVRHQISTGVTLTAVGLAAVTTAV
ncbi:MFS transporter [Kitasatospora sp. NPDC048296]|uniref:MFS transporter n=1 Tax=Kitasatospora sp. NPDC048296 TaxID=3364048 RepID=UPI00371358B8